MSLADDNLRFVVLHAMADAVTKELGKLRKGHTSTLIEQYETTKGTAYKVSLPGSDAVVATVTLRVPQSELEFPEGTEGEDSAFVKWAAANHPDLVQLEHVPAEPERVVPAKAAYDVPFVDPKKLAELSKHFTKGDDGEVVDTSTGLIVEGARWSTPAKPSQFAVTYESDGREQLGTAYRAGKLNEVIGGTTLGAITAGPVVERRLVTVPAVAPEPTYDEDAKRCGKCGDEVASLSSAGLCDGCEIVLEQQAAEDDWFDQQQVGQLPPADPADVDVDALGPEYGDGVHQLPTDPVSEWLASPPVR